MALQGTIKDFGLAEILQLLGIQRKSGVLSVDNGEDVVTVTFFQGQIVGADAKTRNLEDLLGSVLVRTGRITEGQLQDALRVQRSTLQRLGYVLVRSGSISETDLREALRIQVSQIVYRLFRWRSGSYHFTPTEHVEYDEEHFTPIGAETILMEGARMIDEWPIIERRLRSPSLVFRKTEEGDRLDTPVASLVEADVDLLLDRGDADEPSSDVRLSAEERDVLHMVNGRHTVQDIVDRCPLGEFDTYRILYDLLDRTLIQEVREESSERADAADDRRARIRAALLCGVVFALAAFSLATLRANPLSPWRLSLAAADTDALNTYASRGRLERIERALRLHYLDRGSLPARLGDLVAADCIRPSDLSDPWGRPYGYEGDAAGYAVGGTGPTGEPSESLVFRRRLLPSQRLLLGDTPVPSPPALP
jgi:hypothetical protein